MPRLAVEPAVAVAGVSVSPTGLIVAPAAGAERRHRAHHGCTQSDPSLHCPEYFPAAPKLNPPRGRPRDVTPSPAAVTPS